MLSALVLLGLTAFGMVAEARDDHHCCSAQDRHIVEEQWKSIWTDTESSAFRAGIGRHILTTLADRKSDVAELFKGVDIANPEGGAFTAHSLRIFDAIDSIINTLEHPDVLDAFLDHLADQHKVRPGVKREHFVALGDILSESLIHVLDDYNALSWKACFKGILGKLSGKLQA